MKVVDQLEQRLLEHWRRQESRKTWQEWMQWLQSVQCPLRLERPEQVAPGDRLNFQTLLHFCSTALARLPDWESKLTTPNWLESHQLRLLPLSWQEGRSPASEPSAQQGPYLTEEDLAGTHQALLRLAEEVDKVKNRLEQLERQQLQQPRRVPTPPPPPPGGRPLSQPGASRPAAPKPLPNPIATQALEQELRFRQPTTNKPKEFVPESFDAPNQLSPQPLDEVYLSFNDWCDHLYSIGLNLQDLSEEELRVASTRPISFLQFSHRMERRVVSPERLHDQLETFRLHYRAGFPPNSPPQQMPGLHPIPADVAEETSSLESGNAAPDNESAFILPPEDLYQDYNSWLDWLVDQDLDPSSFASQDLRVESSHRISFPQFRRRLERKLDDPAAFWALLGVADS